MKINLLDVETEKTQQLWDSWAYNRTRGNRAIIEYVAHYNARANCTMLFCPLTFDTEYTYTTDGPSTHFF
jgi:hypothetical protein